MNSKTVVVTGGAKGIGRAIAVKFAENGFNIVLNYRSSFSDDLVSEIKSKGVGCLPFKADVSVSEQADELIKAAVSEFKTIDVLVNNAGINKDALIMRMSESDFDSVINVNLKSAFNTIKSVSKFMLKQKSGSIVNMSSVVGVSGNVGQANYAASKAGIIGLTKSAAKEFASRGITCNAIAPGFIITDMTEALPEKVKEAALGGIPLKRFGLPEEVASLALFLAQNRYITGQVISIDGGMAI